MRRNFEKEKHDQVQKKVDKIENERIKKSERLA